MNVGSATTKNIIELMEKIEEKVLLENKVKLEREIIVMK